MVLECSPHAFTSFLLLSKNMHVRLFGDSKLGLRVIGCFTLCPCDGAAYCSPEQIHAGMEMEWMNLSPACEAVCITPVFSTIYKLFKLI